MNETKRKLLFLIICLPIRFTISYIYYIIPTKFLSFFSIPLFIIGLSTLYLYFSNLRLNAYEGGGNTWWKEFRLLHGLLFTSAAIYALNKSRYTFFPLLIDAIIGFILFIDHHYINKLV